MKDVERGDVLRRWVELGWIVRKEDRRGLEQGVVSGRVAEASRPGLPHVHGIENVENAVFASAKHQSEGLNQNGPTAAQVHVGPLSVEPGCRCLVGPQVRRARGA